jgi:CheY-like chemotaxis protein
MRSIANILLVEDNPADVRLAQEALKEHKLQNTLHVVTDGEQALAYLRQEGPFQSATEPDMILLDINLPKVDGIEVMAAMQQDARLKCIPVIIMTTSHLDEVMLKRYNVPVKCHIQKPLTLERYLEAVQCFPQFGLSIVKIAGA